MIRRWPAITGDVLSSLALVAWVGGHAALGAFAARIAFRELPRAQASDTMTKIFSSFDGLIAACMVILIAAIVLRLLGTGLARRADKVVAGSALALFALGAFELAWVHPKIVELFHAGRTLDPEFASLHKLSARCANLEIGLSALLLTAQAWARR
jgi:hypothetical protein